MRIFENPANGYRKKVDGGASVGVFFFGGLYLAVKGLWRHVFIWLVLVVPATAATGGPGIMFFVPLASLIYAFTIQGILANDYLASGWREVSNISASEWTSQKVARLAAEAEGRVFDSSRPATHPENKKCPFCAEDVKYEAIKCKHCQSDLTVA